MARVGHAKEALLARGRLAFGALALLAAALSSLFFRGFTVDDALIAVRYARHLAEGAGYRFNAGGPMTDGVTPLPWAFVLAPMAHADALTVLARAAGLGVVAWFAAAAAWGVAIGRAEAPAAAKLAAVATLALCTPVAAYATSGMETPIAVALATLASLACARPYLAAALAGLAATFRPELAAWALALAAGLAVARGMKLRALGVAAVAIAPFAACALVRLAVFGRPAPLALLAKPSDAIHGALYAGAALVVSLAALLAFSAPRALARHRADALPIAIAGCVHFATIAVVGGDWMPYARLAAPVAPSLLYAFVIASGCMTRAGVAIRGVAVVGVGVALLAGGGARGRNVAADRAALIASARPLLSDAHEVAALDIGWASAATEAPIVDLAGLTDPDFAVLPGGHTSKRFDASMLLDRDVDAILVYTTAPNRDDWRASIFSRVTDARIARDPMIEERYRVDAFLPLGANGAGYFVLRRR